MNDLCSPWAVKLYGRPGLHWHCGSRIESCRPCQAMCIHWRLGVSHIEASGVLQDLSTQDLKRKDDLSIALILTPRTPNDPGQLPREPDVPVSHGGRGWLTEQAENSFCRAPGAPSG